jgi:hypothetical protein
MCALARACTTTTAINIDKCWLDESHAQAVCPRQFEMALASPPKSTSVAASRSGGGGGVTIGTMFVGNADQQTADCHPRDNDQSRLITGDNRPCFSSDGRPLPHSSRLRRRYGFWPKNAAANSAGGSVALHARFWSDGAPDSIWRRQQVARAFAIA